MELRDKEQRNRVYDMGGVQEWFGPIRVEANEPVFHHPWERRVFGSLLTTNAMLGITEEGFRWTEGASAPSAVPRRLLPGLARHPRADGDRSGRARAGRARRAPRRSGPKARGHVRPGLLKRTLTREVVRAGVASSIPAVLLRLTRGSRTSISTRWRHRGSRPASASRCPRHHRMATRGVRGTRGVSPE